MGTAVKNIVAGILTNKDKSAVLTLAAKIACYIRKPSNVKEFMLDITSPINTGTTVPPTTQSTSEGSTSDATPVTLTSIVNEITLGDNKWFAEKEATTDDFKRLLFDQLDKAKDLDLALWGPWFCLSLLRLEKRSKDPFLNKLTSLNSNLFKLYTSGDWQPITVASTGFSRFIEGYTGINVNDNLKFTLYDAIIDYYNTCQQSRTWRREF